MVNGIEFAHRFTTSSQSNAAEDARKILFLNYSFEYGGGSEHCQKKKERKIKIYFKSLSFFFFFLFSFNFWLLLAAITTIVTKRFTFAHPRHQIDLLTFMHLTRHHIHIRLLRLAVSHLYLYRPYQWTDK